MNLKIMSQLAIRSIRAFNRFYTGTIGLLNKHLPGSPYSLPEGRVLYELAMKKNITARDIQLTVGMDKSYLSRLLKDFEHQKIISRHPSKKDGRATFLHLTQKGKKIFTLMDQATNTQILGILQPLSAIEQKKLIHHLQAVMQLLSAKQTSS